MEATSETKPAFAWQPLTPRGVSLFAGATLTRLLVVQFLVAALFAGEAIWFAESNWTPVVEEAISLLPTGAELRSGQLRWPGPSAERLAENSFLSIAVDLEHTGLSRGPAHVQIEFGRTDVRVISLLGFIQLNYPTMALVPCDQAALEPWWGAWKPILLALFGAAIVLALLCSWAILATLYCIPVRLFAFFTDRVVNLRGAWRLSGAALLPGALFMTAAAGAYALAWFDLLRLAVALAVHFAVGWLYLCLSPLRLPRDTAAARAQPNPFSARPGQNAAAAAPPGSASESPQAADSVPPSK